jgi:hypothetical protein
MTFEGFNQDEDILSELWYDILYDKRRKQNKTNK